MNRKELCSKPRCTRLAVMGEQFCDPCLEAEEERAVKVTVERLPPTEPRPKRMANSRGTKEKNPAFIPIPERVESTRLKFEHARAAGNRIAMSQCLYYARRICLAEGLPIPEWASHNAEWKATKEVNAAGILAGKSGMKWAIAEDLFRAAFVNGALEAANGNATLAAETVGIHRNTIDRWRVA